jgi:aspartate-semialdehyde dehydrogenase
VGDDDILVGRIRADRAHPGAAALFLSYDAIRLAAMNALDVGESILRG